MIPKPIPLSILISGISGAVVQGDKDVPIHAIRYDSRQVQDGDLFVAIKGYTTDGHRYIKQAVAGGAVAVIHEQSVKYDQDITTVQVPSSRRALAQVSACYYDYPQRDLSLIGVTGTNGKTTIAYMLWSIFQAATPPAGMVGTIENRIGTDPLPAIHTTPESPDLQELFNRMRREDVHVTTMEVSSHALVLDRVYGLDFSAAIFTNLSHEHLDFHHTLEEYRDAKAILFKSLGDSATAVLNDDDPVGRYYRSVTPAKVWMYSLKNSKADLYGYDVESDWGGTRLTVRAPQGNMEFETTLAGGFNASNMIASIGAAMALGVSGDMIQKGLASLKAVPGRFERVQPEAPFTIIVDYAHTPDALDNCLRAAKAMPGKRLITVFGCGGDRDRRKRPVMGKVAQDLSDVVVVTSDNPRTEDPDLIIKEVLAGMDPSSRVITEVDRRIAIAKALEEARSGDVVMVAGKGHETYQIIQDRKQPFDDRQVIAECL